MIIWRVRKELLGVEQHNPKAVDNPLFYRALVSIGTSLIYWL